MTKCQNCGKVINNPVDQYGECNWILCRHCDWELQSEHKFDDTTRTIDAGQQITFLTDEYQVNDAR